VPASNLTQRLGMIGPAAKGLHGYEMRSFAPSIGLKNKTPPQTKWPKVYRWNLVGAMTFKLY